MPTGDYNIFINGKNITGSVSEVSFAGNTLSNIDSLIKQAPAGEEIAAACDRIKIMLLEKNISYGNSALEPIRIFSKAGADEQLRVRIDDKLNRIYNNKSYFGDNDLDDLLGYLILFVIANKRASAEG